MICRSNLFPKSLSDWDRNGSAEGAFSSAMMTAIFARSSGEYCKDLGHAVWEANNPRVAPQILKGANPIDVLVVDYAMPGMNGAALIDAARACRPGIKAILITGHPEHFRTSDALETL